MDFKHNRTPVTIEGDTYYVRDLTVTKLEKARRLYNTLSPESAFAADDMPPTDIYYLICVVASVMETEDGNQVLNTVEDVTQFIDDAPTEVTMQCIKTAFTSINEDIIEKDLKKNH